MVSNRVAASLGVGILITTALLMMLVPAPVAIYLRINSRRLQRETALVQPVG